MKSFIESLSHVIYYPQMIHSIRIHIVVLWYDNQIIESINYGYKFMDS